jgi:hypothetical protein
MSRNLPVPLRSARPTQPDLRRPDQPEVIVINPAAATRRQPHPLARLAIGLAPDILHALERSLAQRGEVQPAPSRTQPPQLTTRLSGIQLSEVEYDLRAPFVRKVTVRRASAWAADLPQLFEAAEPQARGGGLRRAGVVGAGAIALAALGVLANRAGNLPGRGWRRW